MEKGITVTFIGHRECPGVAYDKLCSAIRWCIEQGAIEFLSGGMGTFDWMAARAVCELKKEYPSVQNTLVIPYLSFKIQERSYFDCILYPEGFERYHFKAAIPARNRYMVDHAQIAICYIDHDWGGAFKTYERAQKKGLQVINLGELEMQAVNHD